MGMNQGRAKQIRERALAQFYAEIGAIPQRARLQVETALSIAAFNVRVLSRYRTTPAFYPTIATCIAAQRPILTLLCPGCNLIGTVDLRELDYHSQSTIGSLIPKLSCRNCCPNPPLARVLGLRKS